MMIAVIDVSSLIFLQCLTLLIDRLEGHSDCKYLLQSPKILFRETNVISLQKKLYRTKTEISTQYFGDCTCRLLTAGGRSPNGSSVITFSSVMKDTEVSDHQHRALLIYFFSLLM